MNELGPDARAILEAARDAHDPDIATRARMRNEVLRRIGAGTAAATAVAATASKTGAAPMAAMLAKVLAVAALATGSVFAGRALRDKPAVAVVEPRPPAIVEVPRPTAQPVVSPPPALTSLVDPVATTAPPVATIAAAAKPKPVPVSTLEDELRTLRAAHLALRDGRASDALSMVESMKGTALGPERAATRVLCLCALGRSDARAAAEAFVNAHPTSPLAPRVRSACTIP